MVNGKKFKILFVGDTNLGAQGLDILKKHFTFVTSVIWDIQDRDNQNNTNKIKKIIHSQMWDICLSFYSDFIFDDTDLAHMHLPLNIHPSLPALPGVGYDTLPLIEDHKYFGSTLHYIIMKIDAGKIINILQQELPEDMTYSQLRKKNQNLCLEMLEITAKDIYYSSDLSHVKSTLDTKSNDLNANWGVNYTSRYHLNTLLNGLKEKEPNHRVFR